MAALNKCREACRHHAAELLRYPGVVAVGIGEKWTRGVNTGEVGLVVSVVQKKAKVPSAEMIPIEIEGVPTDVIQTGEIKALELSPTAHYRPAPGGVSIGHHQITAGTLGAVLRQGGRDVILSNNHVLANSNAGTPGDPILQPGPYDMGGPSDEIATLGDFVPLTWEGSDGGGGGDPSPCPIARAVAAVANGFASFLGRQTRLQAIVPQAAPQAASNLVDAALAIPHNPSDITRGMLNRPADVIKGYIEPAIGMPVVKSGRTTGITFGHISQIEAVVRVSYGSGKTAMFERQIVITGDGGTEFSAGGDSGSAILNADTPDIMVGLLFAGGGGVTIGNRAQDVFDALGLTP